MAQSSRFQKYRFRFGIGEWYGKSFIHLTPLELREFARIQGLKKKDRPTQMCPARQDTPCTKEGGICSIRMYRQSSPAGDVSVAPGDWGSLRTTCPHRFLESGTIFEWVGQTVLDCSQPLVVKEVGFLQKPRSQDNKELAGKDDVGRIDMVLVNPQPEPMRWCALEIQAVYFSGSSMKKEFTAIENWSGAGLPFPAGHRRPDYRSSGPKRLMPQLQIKVPTLRRWGKKMAVVVDQGFFGALGDMDHVNDIWSCDIAWFVTKYEENTENARLVPDFVQFTTLEKAVEGLTGGIPVSLNEFEKRIKEKIGRQFSTNQDSVQ